MRMFNIIVQTIIILHTSVSATVYWDWRTINITTAHFPQSFEWGSTLLSYEADGCARNSSWYAWEKHDNHNNKAFVQEFSGTGSDHWNHYIQDIQLMKNNGLTSFCFSIDWSKVEPEEGFFDETVLIHYVQVCQELVNNGIKPIIILKDYCDPLWFSYLGGFEKQKNNDLFEQYCTKVYETLHMYVHDWITFWSPEGYAMLGYLAGTIPPGVSHAHKAFTVLKNELEAHVHVYKKLKTLPGGNNARIGITKHMHLLEPWYPWDRITCALVNRLINDSFYTFFITGTFDVKIPLPGRAGAWVRHHNANACKSIDFIGVNYHSHGYIKNFHKHISNPKEIPTDIEGITVYAEGFYASIQEISQKLAKKLDIPIFITQNGIATTDESIRDLYLKRHLYALSKAIADGCNVQGYYYYSLIDCHSWGSYNNKFGLFLVDRSTLERVAKPGAKYYFDNITKNGR